MKSEKKPIKVRLAQISQRVGSACYLPYSVGLLQAYAQAYLTEPAKFHFLPPVYQRFEREQALCAFEGVALAGFSVYIWNIQRSLMMARAIRETQPEALILFGGPQVPDRAEAFLREHPYIDLCCHGEGEELFLNVLEKFETRQWKDIAGVSWLDQEGQFHHRPPAPRSRNLDDFPSPFLDGVFEPLFKEHQRWYSPFETNRGCPFSCTFCDWGSALQSKVVRFPESRLFQEIKWLAKHEIISVFCADANFGILKRDLDIAQELARIKTKYGYPHAFQIQTAKNVTGRVVEIQKILTRAGLSASAAISLQSLDTLTLKNIRRENISLLAYQQMQQDCLLEGIFTYTDIIMGLPGETYSSFADGVGLVMENGQYNKALFHDAALLPNAEMAQPEYRQKYGLETTLVVVPAHLVPADGIPELMEIVVATKDLSRQDWVRTHVFAWMTSFLFYTHKLLQLVFMILKVELEVPYRDLIELFMDGDLTHYPVLDKIRESMTHSAIQQQKGYPESQHDTLVITPTEGTYLTPDISMQLQLGNEGLFDTFYAEAADYLARYAMRQNPNFPMQLLREAFVVNRHLFIKTYRAQRLPLKGISHFEESGMLTLTYNLPEFFYAMIRGQRVVLEAGERKLVQI